MKKTSKALLLMLCAVLLVAASVLGTMAYLTSQDSVTNTFTVGNVKITLDEQDVDDDDNKTDNVTVNNVVRDKANAYHLLPGHTYVKDPTIHVDSKSEDCYLFVKVENGIVDIEGTKTVATQMAEKGWIAVPGTTNVYVYTTDKTNPAAVTAGSSIVVFDNFTVDGTKVVNVPTDETVPDGKLDIEDYNNKTITVTAYAVQKDGFESKTAAEIWETAGF